jgi:hypothetical protein
MHSGKECQLLVVLSLVGTTAFGTSRVRADVSRPSRGSDAARGQQWLCTQRVTCEVESAVYGMWVNVAVCAETGLHGGTFGPLRRTHSPCQRDAIGCGAALASRARGDGNTKHRGALPRRSGRHQLICSMLAALPAANAHETSKAWDRSDTGGGSSLAPAMTVGEGLSARAPPGRI